MNLSASVYVTVSNPIARICGLEMSDSLQGNCFYNTELILPKLNLLCKCSCRSGKEGRRNVSMQRTKGAVVIQCPPFSVSVRTLLG